MKKFLSLLLTLAVLLSLAACHDDPATSSLAESEASTEAVTSSEESSSEASKEPSSGGEESSKASSAETSSYDEDVPFTPIASVKDYFESKTYSGDLVDVHYLFHEPIRDTGKDYPLVIFLHGLGDTVNVNALGTASQLVNSLIKLENRSEKYSTYTLIPSTPLSNEGWWTTDQLTSFKALISRLAKDYDIDLSRVYIMGISMGGMVTCQLLNEVAPYSFAAAVPMSGANNLRNPEALSATAIRIYHVASDPVVNVSQSRNLYNQLKNSGHPKAEYIEFEFGSHTSPLSDVFIEDREEFFDWLFAQRLPTGQFSQFYW